MYEEDFFLAKILVFNNDTDRIDLMICEYIDKESIKKNNANNKFAVTQYQTVVSPHINYSELNQLKELEHLLMN